MPDETEDRDETNEVESKPTITIAEKQGSQPADAKPTITIAEKDGGN
ncbi:MAG TPA: hypothetical protein VMZ26_15740 [Pyrinomonadaceae bacterium]|nr:hypothetical protein [Pyrinomonadaceae bacterium]